MTRFRTVLELSVKGPLLSRGSGMQPIGIDETNLSFHNESVLLGSHVRGHIRHAFDTFVSMGALRADTVADWLGSKTDRHDGGRGDWCFAHFFRINGKDPGRHELIRIQLDDNGNVESDQLLMMQSQYGYGADLTVTGWMEGRFANEDDAEHAASYIKKGLEWAGALGGEKAIGFGRVIKVGTRVVRAPDVRVLETQAQSGELTKSNRWSLAMQFDRPLCFAESQRASHNRFESVAYVPGAAVIATLAGTGKLDTETLDGLRVSHAHATPDGQSGAVPLSVGCVNTEDTYMFVDASQHDGPFVVDTGQARGVPRFVNDWKNQDWEAFTEAENWPSVPETDWLEVRTAITPGRREVLDESLFSYLCVSHIDLAQQEHTPRTWACELDVRALDTDQRRALADTITTALRGPFGKTGAQLTALQLATQTGQKHKLDTEFSVYLTSDACLLPDVTETHNARAYAAYWQEVSGGELTLKQAFARERLAGGRYIHRRFKANSDYRPDRLTVAGSVFRLISRDSDTAASLIEGWQLGGLPEAARYRDRSWQHRPWSRHNGFGRIRPVPTLSKQPQWSLEDV